MALNGQLEDLFFSTESNYSFNINLNDDEVDNMDYDDEEKGPALEIYGTDLTL